MRYHAVRALAVALIGLLFACGDNDDPPPVDADTTDAGPIDSTEDCDAAGCAQPTCTDGTENGDETDVDCGGSCAPSRRCGDGLGCGGPGDCQSGVCTGGTCAAPACGDGVRQGQEACDDGNQTNGDGCDDGAGGNCRPTGCGNGVRSGTEECDDGNSTQGDGCDNNCTNTGCGNGVITTGEVCDDDDAMGGDGCSATCQVEPGFTCSMVPSVCVGMCGDGVVVGTEACDDPAPAENGDGCSITCTLEPGFTCTGSPSMCTTSCGDGVRAGGEGCDDAPPAESGDGCNAACFVEPGWVCVGTPSFCFPICGDGRVVGSEACDDPAPAENGDGCSQQCLVETGYMCSGSPSMCGPICGDGLKLPSEMCDDAPPAEAGDGCSATCVIELGWTCMGTMPSTCTTTCGDGIRAGTEECDDAAPAEDGDGCSATCTVESGYMCTGFMPSTCASVCGDGLVRPGEGCDDAPPAEDGDGCNAMCQVETGYVCVNEPSVCSITCGDGDIDAGEACDDGRNDDGDGCSAACVIEFGFTCSPTTPSVCSSSCGDGRKASNEACDDAPPLENNDGCSATCTLEPGYTCNGNNPTVCAPTCGDNQVVIGEACDDAAPAESGDGCSLTCTIENGWYCNGSPSTCTTNCGDGIPAGTEQCDDMNAALLDGCTPQCRREPTEIEPNEDGTPQTGGAGITGNDFDNAGGVAVSNANNNATMIPIDPSQGPINVLGSIANAGDEDVFQVRNNSTTPYSVRVDVWNRAAGFGIGVPCPSTTVPLVDTGLNIRTATGTVVVSNDDRNGASDRCSAATFTVLQGQTLYIHLVAFGDNTAIAAYALQIVPTALTCPNGVPNAGEECDDGNSNDTDGCRNNCTVTDGCGDGNLDAGEQCDDDNIVAGDGCGLTCQFDISCAAGDTPVIVTSSSAVAIPDDQVVHNFDVSVGTSGAVQRAIVHLGSIAHAADGHLDIQLLAPNNVIRNLSDDNGGTSANYTQTFFDDTATTAITSGAAPFSGRFRPEQSLSTTAGVDMRGLRADGTWSLQITDDTAAIAGTLNQWTLELCVTPGPSCGDGLTNVTTEECDDGNTNNSDACSNTCQITDGCGDGNIDAGEQCDDNNFFSGDGCSSLCQLDISCGAGEVPIVVVNSTATAIPDRASTSVGMSGVLSTIDIPTAGVVRRVIPSISVSHAADAHLDIFLSSPWGAQRDITSDQSGVNYVSTIFSDSASTAITAGTAPFTGTFRPEQSISTSGAAGGFGNQSAQGTWVLRLSDDTVNTAGTLDRWSLALCIDPAVPSVCGNGYVEATETCDDGNAAAGDGCSSSCQMELTCAVGAPVILRSTDAAQLVPDNQGGAFAQMPLSVGTTGAVRRAIAVVGAMSHQSTGNVSISLISPMFTSIDLSSLNGSGNDDYISTMFDDDAATIITAGTQPYRGRFRPEQGLFNLNGEPAAGSWSMRVLDASSIDGGLFQSWALGLCVE